MNQNKEDLDIYLALTLSLQVHHTHIHNGPQVGERLHYCDVGALLVAVHVKLQKTNSSLYKQEQKINCVIFY